ncbi:unnamed protein product [Moneuplotes crassus]|uniref:Uncharacterized protein n=1 Tax=Euplotes crassus TaxID=5936 RepID=A0AAD1XU52_EUPCR|nr:unnamed protein product [Moneuplotes crassus]
MNLSVANTFMLCPVNMLIDCVFIPITTSQMLPIIQEPQQIPDISAYCKCGLLNTGRFLTKTQTNANVVKKKQEPCLPRTKRIRSYNETNTESSNSEIQLKNVRLTDLPRKQKRKNRVFQRLSSFGSVNGKKTYICGTKNEEITASTMTIEPFFFKEEQQQPTSRIQRDSCWKCWFLKEFAQNLKSISYDPLVENLLGDLKQTRHDFQR